MLNFFAVPGTKNLFVSEEGIFSTGDNIRMNPPEKCGKVQLELFGELQWIDKNWIVLASLFGMSDKRFIGNAKFYPLTYKAFRHSVIPCGRYKSQVGPIRLHGDVSGWEGGSMLRDRQSHSKL